MTFDYLPGFERKCFRGKPALGITCNFVNYHTRADSMVQEIGGIFCVYFQDFFNSMKEVHGIDLENFVYYKNETHYFVMTARKKCLLDRAVLKQVRPLIYQNYAGKLFLKLIFFFPGLLRHAGAVASRQHRQKEVGTVCL